MRLPRETATGHPEQQGYRLVYLVEDEVLVVLVLAVAKREDMEVYRAATERLISAPGNRGQTTGGTDHGFLLTQAPAYG